MAGREFESLRARHSQETLVHATPSPRGQFQLVYPRTVNGRPVISPTEKGFSIQFFQLSIGSAPSPSIGGVPGERLRFEFAVKDLLFEGRVAF